MKTVANHCLNPGYLPAEHIETPTERLARLNKHRNIDVGISAFRTVKLPTLIVLALGHNVE